MSMSDLNSEGLLVGLPLVLWTPSKSAIMRYISSYPIGNCYISLLYHHTT